MTTSLRRRLAWAAALFALISGALVMLWPVLVAPVNADQRYLYLTAPGRTGSHWLRLVTIPWHNIPTRLHEGRFDPLSEFVQFLSYTGVTNTSLATGTPEAVVQGMQKVVLVALAVLAVVLFAACLRGRTSAGALVSLDPRALGLISAGALLLGAAGVQAQAQFRNGWTSYAVLTYGAVVVGLGVPALALWLSQRLVRVPRRSSVVLAVGTMVAVGVALNTAYELFYVAVPVALLALVLQPVSASARSAAGRRAKLVVGGSLLAAFAVSYVLVHALVSAETTQQYVGIKPSFGVGLLRTWWNNVASSIPGTGRAQAARDVSHAGLGGLPGPFASPLVLWCFVGGVGLLAIRLLLPRVATGADARRAQTVALLQAAGLAATLALGSAAVMSVSVQAQQVIAGIGLPYRHTVVTWVGFAVAVVSLLVAADLWLTERGGIGLWAVASLLTAILGASLLTVNFEATRAERVSPSDQIVDSVYREILLGDPTAAGDRRRCAAVALVNKGVGGSAYTRNQIIRGAYLVYQHRFGRPFCSTVPIPADLPYTYSSS